jgi:hypothetical protein
MDSTSKESPRIPSTDETTARTAVTDASPRQDEGLEPSEKGESVRGIVFGKVPLVDTNPVIQWPAKEEQDTFSDDRCCMYGNSGLECECIVRLSPRFLFGSDYWD